MAKNFGFWYWVDLTTIQNAAIWLKLIILLSPMPNPLSSHSQFPPSSTPPTPPPPSQFPSQMSFSFLPLSPCQIILLQITSATIQCTYIQQWKIYLKAQIIELIETFEYLKLMLISFVLFKIELILYKVTTTKFSVFGHCIYMSYKFPH